MSSSHESRCVDVLFQANATLGEGPIWDPRLACLYWIDIRRSRVSRFDTTTGTQTGVWITDHRPGCVALTRDENKLLLAAGDKIAILDMSTGKTNEVARLPIDAPRFRANDGRVDGEGRLWIGTMIDDIFAPESFSGGQLFCVGSGGLVSRVDDEFELPNGIGWSSDDTLLYLNDTTARCTYCFDYSASTGQLSNKRVFYDHSESEGYPDGLSVDASGCIWSAQWDGWNIRQISPAGDLVEEFAMPVRRPSSAAFYGDQLDQIAVSSATVDFTTKDFLLSPDAGSLFSMDAKTNGTCENFFEI